MVELKKAYNLNELLENCPKNTTICDNLLRAYKIINDKKYKKIVCSISGGSDSDIMLDIVWRCDKDNKVTYVWFNTGLEYQATKDHLKSLEEKYQIEIKSYKAIKAIPLSCREYGQPFISKQVSEYIQRLQRHGFQWDDDSGKILRTSKIVELTESKAENALVIITENSIYDCEMIGEYKYG